MLDVSLLVLVEAGQVRNLATASFRLPLPDCLLWGSEAIARMEAQTEEVDSWPPVEQLECVVILNRDTRSLIRAGSSGTFETPYQLALFDRMLQSVWPGYQIDSVAMTADSLREAMGGQTPPVDTSLPRQLFSDVLGEEDEDDWEEEEDEDDPYRINDFRKLAHPESFDEDDGFDPDDDFDEDDEFDPDEEDENTWWVSVRHAGEATFQHYSGDFVWEALASSGPELLDRLQQLPDDDIPAEAETYQGILLDAVDRTICYWAHPRGVVDSVDFGGRWGGWSTEQWLDNGFRRQLDACGATDFIPPSDTAVLADFVPQLAEQPDFAEMVKEFKSGFRSCSRKGFGCLAVVLAIPAALAWLVSGSWEGPFAFAAGLWLVVYIGYRLMLMKFKRSFFPDKTFNQDTLLPKIAPESKQERIARIDQALAAARLPSFQQINHFAEME